MNFNFPVAHPYYLLSALQANRARNILFEGPVTESIEKRGLSNTTIANEEKLDHLIRSFFKFHCNIIYNAPLSNNLDTFSRQLHKMNPIKGINQILGDKMMEKNIVSK